MAERKYISIDESYDIGTLEDWYINSVAQDDAPVWTEEHLKEMLNDFYVIPKDTPTADVVLVKHGHIVWKDRCEGGFKTAKCLHCTKGSVFCNHTAKYDNRHRHRCRDPYCSECGKPMGSFNNYCGNCGAKMDGGENNGT